ncbi:MAG: dTDP-4-dehydrorhamnose reductase [Acidobacteria bacterium]|nr:dTDP-4-dehydrorhamnose reductase [Acidobacteriota bacterium]
MRVLVTGSQGQLVRCLMDVAPRWPDIALVFAGRPEADLAEPGSIARAIAAQRPNAVLNAAAYTAVDLAEDEPDKAFRINAEAAGEAAAAAAAIGAPIMHVSTDYVFDGAQPGAYHEDAPTGPINVYGRTKLAGEEQVRAANPDFLIARTAWVFSPFGNNFVNSMVKAAGERESLSVVDDQRGSPTSGLELAAALLGICDRWRAGERVGLGETYHLTGSGAASWFDFAREVVGQCAPSGRPAAKVLPVPSSAWPTRAPRPANTALDCAKIERDFGLGLPDWRVSVGEVVARIVAER